MVDPRPPGDMSVPEEGSVHTIERTFTTEDVRRFAAVSGDTQPRHTEPDEEGRLLVHGLLTATLPTRIGGDLEVLAHEMEFTFHRRVHTGEPITCEWRTESVEERTAGHWLSAAVECRNAAGEAVLTATVSGLVRT